MEYSLGHEKVFIQFAIYTEGKAGYEQVNRLVNRAVFESLTRSEIESLGDKMNAKEELFAKFFSQAVIKATDLSMEQLVSWLDELEEIIFEAKALAQGAEKVKKERVSKLRSEERDKLISRPDIGVSDAINTVAKRKDRMSKIDKLVESMRTMGLSEEDIKKAVGNISVNEDTQPSKNNIVTFNKRDTSKVDADKILADAAEAVKPVSSEPFDPTKLFG